MVNSQGRQPLDDGPISTPRAPQGAEGTPAPLALSGLQHFIGALRFQELAPLAIRVRPFGAVTNGERLLRRQPADYQHGDVVGWVGTASELAGRLA